MGENRIKLVSILCAIVVVATVFSVAVKNVSACSGGDGEKDIESLNPDVATNEYVHIVWQENLTGNYEIYYANNLTGAYKTELSDAVQKVQSLIANTTDKKLKSELEKVLKELNKALANATANDYQHSFKHLQHAVEKLDKKDLNCGEIITALVNSARDITKVNILYREFLNISQNHVAKAREKFYKGLEKLDEEKYDKAVNEFRKAFKEAYKIDDDCEDEECSKKTNAGIDFGEIVRISYTEYNSTNPTVYLNGTIHVGWVEKMPDGDHVFYARSTNSISWWYFDATKQASHYLSYWDIDLGLIDFGLDLSGIRDRLKDILGILEQIWIWIKCHLFWGRLRDGTYASISDPWLDRYSDYTTVTICGHTLHMRGCGSPPPPPPPNGDDDHAADLTVSDISFSPTYSGYVFTTDTVRITATIYNKGDATATGITVRFWDNGVQIDDDKTIAYLDPGATKTRYVSCTLSAGTHSIRVRVDPDDTIPDEGDEYNNELTENIKALDPAADEEPDGLSNYDELCVYSTEPENPDTDEDGLLDGDEVNGEVTRYIVDKGDKGYLFFKTNQSTNYPGYTIRTFTYKTNPRDNDTDDDGQNDFNDLVPLDYDMDGDGKINRLDIVTPSSSYYVERLAIAAKNDPNLIKSAGVFVGDDDMDEDGKKVLFSDGFENGLNWGKQYVVADSASYVAQTTTDQKHSGSYSVEVYVYQTQTSDKGSLVLYTSFTTQKTGMVTFWFYDDSSIVGTEVVGLRDTSKTTSNEFWIGIRCSVPSKYVYSVGGNWGTTDIIRSTGWHKIWFVADGEYVVGGIDNTLVKTTAYIKTFNWIEIGSYGSGSPGLYFDDVVVSDDFDNDNDGMDDGYEIGYGVANNGWQNPYIYNARYAVLIGGGGTGTDQNGKDENYVAFENDLKMMYDKLEGYGYLGENIYCLFWNHQKGYLNGRVDGPATWGGSTDTLCKSIEEIGSKITKNDFFYFAEICHGGYGTYEDDAHFNIIKGEDFDNGITTSYSIYIAKGALGNSLKNPIDNYIGDCYARSLFVFQSCNSEKAIENLNGKNRIIITATKSNEPLAYSWKSYYYSLIETVTWEEASKHWEFIYNEDNNGFLRDLGSPSSPKSILDAYYSGYDAARDNDPDGPFGQQTYDDTSHPLLDDNFDGVGHTKGSMGDDGNLAKYTYL